ncbi:31680_t:CDS:2, partial [Gigaspora margarita]
MPIWDDYDESEEDGHGHFGATHLALHCKEPALDDIRRRWLVEVAKREITKALLKAFPNYAPPHKDALSGTILNKEIAQIIVKLEAELQKKDNLTLSLDSWTFPRGDSLYNYIITTPSHHRYLYVIADYSGEHQTGDFIANKISEIIKKIGPHHFVAIVTNNGSNIFKEQLDIFTNKDVYKIVFNKDNIFYTSCKRLALVFKPIKQVINFFESRTANLADCFVGIAQIAASFKRIHPSNDLCTPAIALFNFRFEQFNISPYLLTYFLYPSYRTRGLKKENFIVEDEHTHLEELAKTMFAITPSQANSQIYSLYVSNIKQKLNFYDKNFEEAELHSSIVNETIFAEVDNNGSNKDKDEIEIENLMATDITKVLQDLVGLSDPIFEANNKEEITLMDEEETTMKFDSRSLVQNVLSDDDLY